MRAGTAVQVHLGVAGRVGDAVAGPVEAATQLTLGGP